MPGSVPFFPGPGYSPKENGWIQSNYPPDDYVEVEIWRVRDGYVSKGYYVCADQYHIVDEHGVWEDEVWWDSHWVDKGKAPEKGKIIREIEGVDWYRPIGESK